MFTRWLTLTFAILWAFSGCAKKESSPPPAPKTGVELVAIGPIFFGGVLVGQQRDAAIRIYNHGPNSLSTTDFSAKLGPPFYVQSIGSPCNTGTLPAGSSCIVSIRFQPLDPGNFSQDFVVGGTSLTTTGRGLLGGVIQLSDTSWEVGETIAGTEVRKTITISNLGDFTVSSPTPAWPAGVSKGFSTCGAFLAKQTSCIMEIVMKKTLAGALSETFIFDSGDGGQPSFTLITLVKPAEPAGAISFNSPPPFIVADGVAEYTVATLPIRDQYLNIVADGTNVRLSSSNATLLTSTPQLSSGGVVSFTFRAPTVKGEAIISVLSGEATGLLRTPALAGPPAGAIEVQTYPLSIVANGQSNVEFRTLAVKDQFGNVVENNTPIYFFLDGPGNLSLSQNLTFFGQTSVVLTSSTTAGTATLQVRGGPIYDVNNQIVGWRASGDFPIQYLPGVAAGTIPISSTSASIYAEPDPAIEQQGFAIRATITVGPVRDANNNLVAENTPLFLTVEGGINGTYQNQANPVPVFTNAAGLVSFFIEGNGTRGPINISVTGGAGASGNLIVHAIKDTTLSPDNTLTSKFKIQETYATSLPNLNTTKWASFGQGDYIPLRFDDRIFMDIKHFNVNGSRPWITTASYLSYPCMFSDENRVHLGPCFEDNLRDKAHFTWISSRDTATWNFSDNGVLFNRGFQEAIKPTNPDFWNAAWPAPKFPGIGYNPQNKQYIVLGGLYYDNSVSPYIGNVANRSSYFFPMNLYGSSKTVLNASTLTDFDDIGVHPPASALMSFTSKNQYLFGFGGYVAGFGSEQNPRGQVFNQLYVYNTAQSKWSSIQPQGDPNETDTNGEPSPRFQNGFTFDPSTNSLYIFGGQRRYSCQEFLTKSECNLYRACSWDDHDALGLPGNVTLNASQLNASAQVFGEGFCQPTSDSTCQNVHTSVYGSATEGECSARVGCIWSPNALPPYGAIGCFLRPGTPDGRGEEYTDAKDIWQLPLAPLDAGDETGLQWKKLCDSKEPFLGRNPNLNNPAYRSCNLPAGAPGVPTVYPDIENGANLPKNVSAVWNDLRQKIYLYWSERSEVKVFDPITQTIEDATDGAQTLAGAFQVLYNKFAGRMFGYTRGTPNGLNSFINVWETSPTEKYYQRVTVDLGAGARDFTYAIRPQVRGAGKILHPPWNNGTTYQVGDRVSNMNQNYVAVSGSTGQEPGSGPAWEVFTGPDTNGLRLHLWNFTTEAWDLVSSNTNTDTTDLIVLQNTALNPLIQGAALVDYIGPAGKVEMLISNNGNLVVNGSHEIHLDSVSLDGRF